MSTESTARESTPSRTSRRGELLGFYDRVRSRIESFLERKGGRLGTRAAAALLLVPDVLLLLVRLFLDRRTPQSSRALIGGALAYFILPADLAPEIVLGPVGFLDDLVIATTVLGHVLGGELETVAKSYWSGSQRSLQTLGDISRSGSLLLGADLARRVESVLERRVLKRMG